MKKFLFTLFVWFVWLISFCSATINSYYDEVEFHFTQIHNYDYTFWNDSMDWWLFCFNYQKEDSSTPYWTITDWSNDTMDFYGWYHTYCTRDFPVNIHFNDLNDYYFFASYTPVVVAWEFPEKTQSECEEDYSLMPIESCNSEYCEMNDLCSTIWWSWSSTLYINDVRHESAPFIYVNIPEEFKRDYLTWVNEFTINVEWLNGDQDYINWIIDVNSFRPSSEDFTETFVWWLTLIFPYIIITAVILFIRRFIRKIFK